MLKPEYLEEAKRIIKKMPYWWNRFTTAEDIPSLGTIARYGIHIGGKGQMFKQTEEIAINLASMSDEARLMAQWMQLVRKEMGILMSKNGKSPNKIAHDKAVCNTLYFRAALGYTTKRIAECAYGVAIQERRVRDYLGIAIWEITEMAVKAGLFNKKEAED